MISVIYNDKISLKEAECCQKNLEKKELKFNYKGRRKGRNKFSIDASKWYRDKIIDVFTNVTLPSEYLKKSDDAGYKYVLKDVKKFTQEIKSMSKKLI